MLRGLSYRADIDGLRAIAVLAVVAFHAVPSVLPGGFVGVDVFFVISGYLITSLLRQSLEDGSFRFSTFYARRIRRLAPALVVVLATVLAAGWTWLLTDELAQLAKHAASSVAFMMNLVLWRETGYFDTAAEQKPLLHLWSLGVEEQFYLIWPALLWATWRWRRPAFVIGVVALLSFAANVAVVHTSPTAAFYLPTSRVWELAAGGLLAGLGPPRRGWIVQALSLAGAVLLAVGCAVIRPSMPFPGWWALLPAGGAALLIAAGPRGWTNSVLATRPLVFVGLISYPLYLWHWPILTFARMLEAGPLGLWRTAALVALAVVLAWLTYRFVEQPIRRATGRLVIVNLAVASGGVAAVALAVLVNEKSLPMRFPPQVQALVDFSYRYERPYREGTCYLLPDQSADALARECVEQTPASQPLVVLWGDSHAAHLYPGLRRLQSTRGFRVAQFTGSRCPPLLGIDTPMQPHCQSVNRLALARMRALRPAIVLMAARWEAYEWATLDETVAAVRRATPARIVVMGRVPAWEARLPRLLFAYVRSHPQQPLPGRMFFGVADWVWEVDRQVRARADEAGVEYLSALDALCTDEGCLARVSDRSDSVTAWDDAHLTATGSEYLVSRVSGELFARWRPARRPPRRQSAVLQSRSSAPRARPPKIQ
jgi:peptidoglycan/LPS O-acetylase OafA/YrhL